jgi:hypothetical protein
MPKLLLPEAIAITLLSKKGRTASIEGMHWKPIKEANTEGKMKRIFLGYQIIQRAKLSKGPIITYLNG